MRKLGASRPRSRLRPDKLRWLVGEPLTFMLDIRNRGTRQLHFDGHHEAACEVWYDGQWYHRARGGSATSSPLGPGREYTDVTISLDYLRVTKGTNRPLRLCEGRHTVRVAFTAEPSDPNHRDSIRVLSNPVEIDIVPLKEKVAWGKVVNDLQLGLAFDEEERPYAPGEELALQIYVRNTSDSGVQLSWSDLNQYRPSVQPSSKVRYITGTAASGAAFLPVGHTVLLEPGDTRMLGKTEQGSGSAISGNTIVWQTSLSGKTCARGICLEYSYYHVPFTSD